MLRILGLSLSVVCPFLVFLLEGNLTLTIVSMTLQVTVIGWIPMTYLAWKHCDNISYFAEKTSKPKPSSSKNVE